jgi:hypothetical protein
MGPEKPKRANARRAMRNVYEYKLKKFSHCHHLNLKVIDYDGAFRGAWCC